MFGSLDTAVRFGTNMFLVGYLICRLGQDHWGLVILATSMVAFLSLIQLWTSAGEPSSSHTILLGGAARLSRAVAGARHGR